MASATLATIQEKVRRITRSPSENLLTTAQLNDYINTFILYDFPANLRLFSLRQKLTFYTQPNVDTYATNTLNPLDPLYDFQNRYIAIHQPIFLAGVQGYFTQFRDIFYGYYPQTNFISMTGLFGTGGTGPFTGQAFQAPMLQNNVIFTCLDISGQAMVLVDYPQFDAEGVPFPVVGALGLPNQPQILPSPYGQINYITGQFTLNFPANTKALAPIYIENIVYQPGKPLAMLYFDNMFTIRPVPDKLYAIQIEVDAQPTELINQSDVPVINQWWQYIAYGAAKKIFEDRMDYESLNMMMPSFKEQERLALRTSIMQEANMRTVTIYTEGKQYSNGGWFGATWPY